MNRLTHSRYAVIITIVVMTLASSAPTQSQAGVRAGNIQQAVAMSRPIVQAQGSQSNSKERDPEKAAVGALRRREVPEATLPCSPAEAKWWERVRAESIRIQHRRESDRDKLLLLLQEGRDNNYGVPIPDRGITVLLRPFPSYTNEARRLRISGGIALVTEFLSDGTVGEIKIVEGLPAGLDESSISATRRTIFLPAVKGGQFVTARVPMTMSFNTY